MKPICRLLICIALLWACVGVGPVTAEDVDIANCLRTDLALATQFVACRAAAEVGNADAQFNLGYMYNVGQGVPQDYTEAANWYRRAAEQGNTVAQANLGSLYGNGQGVPRDYTLAHIWLNLAGTNFEDARELRDTVAKQMTPAQIAEAQRLAREWTVAHGTRTK